MPLQDNISAKLLSALKSQEFYNKLGLAAIRIIKSRTRKQVDVQGDFFKDYHPSYVQRKRRLGFADPETVNLTLSKYRGMLNSIDHEVSSDLQSVAVYFDDKAKEQLAVYHNIMGAGKGKVIREFWGIEMQEEIDQLSSLGYRLLKNIFRKLESK